MKVTPLILVLSVVSMAASVVEAQTFHSNNNYNMAVNSSSCTPFKDMKVTVKISENLLSTSACDVSGFTHHGFSLQLNALAPSAAVKNQTHESKVQQFVLDVDQSSITSHTQLFAEVSGDGPTPGTIPDQAIPSPVNPSEVPAGYTLTWDLVIDPTNGQVTQVKYSVTDTNNNTFTTPNPVTIPAEFRAPIGALALDIVGYGNGCVANFTSGAGSITYASTSTPATAFTAQSGIPTCAVPEITVEKSNSIYALLDTGESSTKIVQEFVTQDSVTDSIQAPTAGEKVPEGVAIPLEASAMDSGSDNLFGTELACKSISWTSSDPAATFSDSTGCSLHVTFSDADVGTEQTVTATATDGFGVTGHSTVKVDVVARPAGAVPEAFPVPLGLAGNTAVLKGVVSGGTGTVTAVWTIGSSVLDKQTFSAGAAVTLTPVDTTYGDGTETATLTVTDSAGHTNKVTVEIPGVSQPT